MHGPDTPISYFINVTPPLPLRRLKKQPSFFGKSIRLCMTLPWHRKWTHGSIINRTLCGECSGSRTQRGCWEYIWWGACQIPINPTCLAGIVPSDPGWWSTHKAKTHPGYKRNTNNIKHWSHSALHKELRVKLAAVKFTCTFLLWLRCLSYSFTKQVTVACQKLIPFNFGSTYLHFCSHFWFLRTLRNLQTCTGLKLYFINNSNTYCYNYSYHYFSCRQTKME